MKKRVILPVVFLAGILLVLSSLFVHAEEAPVERASAAAEALPVIDEAQEEAAVKHTLFNRTWEYLCRNKTEVIDAAGKIIVIAITVLGIMKTNKKSKSLASDLAIVKQDSADALGGQGAVIDVVNSMIDAYREQAAAHKMLTASYDHFGLAEEDTNKTIRMLVAQAGAMLDIMMKVWGSSKNLPQGIKDQINLRYAKCLTDIESDDNVVAIMNEIRGKTEQLTDAPPEVIENDQHNQG